MVSCLKVALYRRKRRKRILKLAKGYCGAKHLVPYCKRTSNELLTNAYRDRRQKKT